MTAASEATFSWDAVARYLREITVGEYEILTELGRGGMAAVYLAHEHALNRKVALKVMSPSIMMTEGMVDRFYAEAVTQANLTHAHIVGVHTVRRDQELHYFAMQYVPGRSLQQVLRAEQAAGRALPLAVIRSLLYQVGSALVYAHRRGVIHRDIKPANVLLNADGEAVVTDFGIAKVASNPSQTLTGTVVGTAPYMSPEQCYAAELTGASDQYSLGILAYELLTGSPPFVGNGFVVMQAHTLEPPPPLAPRRPDCPPELEAAVLKMLAKGADDRYADINAALDALEARPAPSRTDDPVRATLVRLADVAGVEAALGDVLRVPLSPMPRTRRAGSSTPVSNPRFGTPPGGYRSLTPKPSRVIMLRLGDPPARIESGEHLRLQAEAMDIHGSPMDGLPLRWSSSNPMIARVNPDTGEIEALTPGSADIVVSCESAVATARLVVREPTVARIVGVGMPDFVEIGDRVSLRVNAFDARGVLLERRGRWSMSSGPTADITADGEFIARAAGTARVAATIEGTTTEFRISVRGPSATAIELSEIPAILGVGEAVTIRATARDKRGNVLSGRSVTWTSSDPGVVEVDPGGRVTGLAGGDATLEARCDDATAVTHVSVGVVPIAALEITGLPERVTQGARKRIEVSARDTDGRIRQIPVTWTSSTPSVATVDASNQLTALSAGQAILRVRGGSAERSFPIEVRENVAISQRALRALSSVPRPAASALFKGLMAAGSIVAVGALIAFFVIDQSEAVGGGGSDSTRGEISAGGGGAGTAGGETPAGSGRTGTDGGATTGGGTTGTGVGDAGAGGAATSAGGGGVSTGGSGPVVVDDTTLQLQIRRVATNMRVNDVATPQLQAIRGRLRGAPRWSSSNPGVLNVEQGTGRATALREGSATLYARIGQSMDSITIRVDRIPVARVNISSQPALTSLRVGESAQARATANDANGNELASRTVEWAIEPPGIATVDAAGVVSGLNAGTARLIASVDNVRDTLALNILARASTPQPDPGATVAEPGTGRSGASGATNPPPLPVPPLTAEHVSNAANDVVGAIVSQDSARVHALYGGGTADGRLRELTRAMLRATNNIRSIPNAGNVAPDEPRDGNSPTARVRRTLEFGYRVTRSRALLDLELTFRREGTGWRLQAFRILNNPSY